MDLSQKIDANKVFTKSEDISLNELRDMYDDGTLITSPDYQREFREDWPKASRLIESVLLNIPIPTVYLCEEIDGTISVIDGQQRITSFVKFLKNEYTLTGLDVFSELKGKYFRDLDKATQTKIKRTSIHATTLLKESQELKYEIFSRLNLGSTRLTPQELRNCIYRGSFNNMLEDIAKNNKLVASMFIGKDLKKKEQQELILRFFALRDYNSYKSSLVKTMNTYMQIHQNDTDNAIKDAKNLFNGTLDIVKQILGEAVFKTYSPEKKIYLEKFSPTAFDSIMIPFSCFPNNSLMRRADDIREKIKDIRENDAEYLGYLEKSASSRASVVGRILKIYNAINSCMTSTDFDVKRIFQSDVKKQLFHEGYVCSYCNNIILSYDDAEIDHTIPFSLGGETSIENAQLLHRHCNREKSNSMEMDWEEPEEE